MCSPLFIHVLIYLFILILFMSVPVFERTTLGLKGGPTRGNREPRLAVHVRAQL